jgi:8-oxo-dGTP pyrophosphatase MutT (NUDIX family)
LNHDAIVKELTNALKTKKALNANAAVVILLKKNSHDFQVLFVNRAKKASDPWSGQTALPGGKRNPEDHDLKQTVIRETLEETNINLLEYCSFLGIMKTVRSVHKPKMRILPFVVLQEKEQDIELNGELIGYFWESLKKLEQNGGSIKFKSKEVPAYIIGNNVVWGLTYKIVNNLLSLLSNIEKEKTKE